ncbi:MAG: hypothetical protein AB7F99_08145 [Vicinamibacterales bacterium]
MRTIIVASLVMLAAAAMTHAASRTVDFSQDSPDQPPKGFEFGHTARVGAPGKWVVQADGGNKYLAQLDADRTSARFPVAVLADVEAADVDLSVRFRPISGQVDQAAGLVWRYQDENNYYIVRANARENNVVLYKVQNGRRSDLPLKGEGRTYGKPSKVPAGQWGTLRVIVKGSLFEVYHNSSKLYEVEDTTFTQPGKVGVWTKADSITHFDDLTVVTQ